MNTHEPGDKGLALCESCGIVDTTYKFRTATDGAGTELIAACDVCDETIEAPATTA